MKYTTLQIRIDTRNKLQKYCKENGHSMSGLVESLIKNKINPIKELPKVDPNRIMKVRV